MYFCRVWRMVAGMAAEHVGEPGPVTALKQMIR